MPKKWLAEYGSDMKDGCLLVEKCVCTTNQSYTHVQYSKSYVYLRRIREITVRIHMILTLQVPVSHSITLVKDENQVRGFTCNTSSIAPLVAYLDMIPGTKLSRIPNHCSHYECLSILGMIDH
jgi:hypothetical protein